MMTDIITIIEEMIVDNPYTVTESAVRDVLVRVWYGADFSKEEEVYVSDEARESVAVFMAERGYVRNEQAQCWEHELYSPITDEQAEELAAAYERAKNATESVEAS